MSSSAECSSYLAVACELGYMSYEDACLVLRQQRLQRFRARVRRVGEIAVEMRYLTRDRQVAIQKTQEQYRADNKTCRDPLVHVRSAPRLAMRLGVAIGVLDIVVLVAIGMVTGWDLQVVGFTVAVFSFVVGAFLAIFQRRNDTLIVLDGQLRYGLGIMSSLGFLAVAYSAYWLFPDNAQGAPFDVVPLFLTGSLLAGLSVVSLLVASVWRHHEVIAHEERLGLLQGCLTRAVHGSGRIQGILDVTAQLVSRSVWCSLVARLGRRRDPAAGLVTAWYLEPGLTDSGTFESRGFAVASPQSVPPNDVEEALKALHDRFKPSVFMQEEFDRVRSACKQQATKKKDWRQIFLDNPQRSEFTSLTGYVFANERPVSTNDASSCLVFDRHYADALPNELRTPEVLQWLTWRSFAAFPVFSSTADQLCVGVMLVFRNMRNGFLENELDYLRCLASALGHVALTAKPPEVTEEMDHD